MRSESSSPWRRPALILAAVACALAAFALAHLGFDSLARGFERRGAALWFEEQHLRLFRGAHFAAGSRPRILFTGSSEAREAFVAATLEEGLPGWKTIQFPWVWSTVEELIVCLEYIERAYGDAAFPEAVAVGVTPRYVAEIREFASPFYAAIDKYSPHFTLRRGEGAPVLVEKDTADSIGARLRYLHQNGGRYRNACKGVARAAVVAMSPEAGDDPLWRSGLTTNTFHHLPDWSLERKRDFFVSPHRFEKRFKRFKGVIRNLARVLAWDPEQDRTAIEQRFETLRAVLARHDARLFLINLPELSWNREGYDPARYEAYLRILREDTGGAPLLDLHDFLSDEEFWDHQHANRAGARRVSTKTAEFLRPFLRE